MDNSHLNDNEITTLPKLFSHALYEIIFYLSTFPLVLCKACGMVKNHSFIVWCKFASTIFRPPIEYFPRKYRVLLHILI